MFCTKHSLSPSVKAGGYGTACWAIGGDIIIDLSKLVEVDIEVPKEDGTFTSLRDVAAANSKGKKVQNQQQTPASAAISAKRRREDDDNLRHYDSASQTVASFLRGPLGLPSSSTSVDGPSPSVRRRVDDGQSSSASNSLQVPQQLSQSNSNSSSSSMERTNSGSGDSEDSREQSHSTLDTTPSPPPGDAASPSQERRPLGGLSSTTGTTSNANPFGYLDSTSNFPPAGPLPTLMPSYPPPPMLSSWGAPSNVVFANMSGDFGQMQIPAQAEPIYPHAYVTFGAGMRQKEIDTYTAQHKLEARYITGSGDGIPYHVPL